MENNKGAAMPGTVVQVVEGFYRGRGGRVVGAPDEGTDSVRVLLDYRSAYDTSRPQEWAWIPICFLRVQA